MQTNMKYTRDIVWKIWRVSDELELLSVNRINNGLIMLQFKHN